jgi:membrane protein DedA with SNARE-associated domain
VPVASFTSFIGDHGIYAIFGLMLVDAVIPAASELVMVYGGALAAGAVAGHVTLFGHRFGSGASAYVAAALAGTIGYVLGSLAGWAIGLYGGRPLLEQHGRKLHLPSDRIDRAEAWFDRWGAWAVFLGRITPVVRSFISIPAGLFRAALGPYTALTAAGSALWAFGLAGAGYALGTSYNRFHHDFRYADYAGIALLVGLVGYLVLRLRSNRLARRADPAR